MPKAIYKKRILIQGMTCTNCANSVAKVIERSGGLDVAVNFTTGEAYFDIEKNQDITQINNNISKLGYQVSEEEDHDSTQNSNLEKQFYFTLIFTVPLFLHMLLPFVELLQNPIVQIALCLPVFIVGIKHFGKSALGSMKTGSPNMDVLIFTGFTAAFAYSLAGTFLYYGTPEVHNYLFFETSATIITLVLFGNVLEHRSVQQTTSAIKELNSIKVKKAKIVTTENGKDIIKEIDYKDIETGMSLIVNTGDRIPVDGLVVQGEAALDESMISGESLPIDKAINDKVIGGTIVLNGNLRLKATSVGSETILSQIIEMVKKAQLNKPRIQKLGDKVSSIFVPIVLLIAVGTFFISHFGFDISSQKALMSSIAVLVISCPCAMGLATPTAIMAGIGRAAKDGILIKGGSSIEEFAKVKNMVFDKTGTITTGKFTMIKLDIYNNDEENVIKDIIFSLEQHSSHPIAKSLLENLKDEASAIPLEQVEELKGLGMKGNDKVGNSYYLGSYSIAKEVTTDDTHTIYLLKNGNLAATIDLKDEIKPNAKNMIAKLKGQGIRTILLSGDRAQKCQELADELQMDMVYGEQLPHQKLDVISELGNQAPTAMVGDGINDAPALAMASVGISLGNATQIAIQSAQIILLKGDDLNVVNRSLQISKHTYLTIKQNLFWAFFYNVVAIPIAAMGFLNPMVGALAMAFSDVIVIGNSIRLKTKKIPSL